MTESPVADLSREAAEAELATPIANNESASFVGLVAEHSH